MLIMVCTAFHFTLFERRELIPSQGLLNIHQQLRSNLKQGKEKATPKDFTLRIGIHTLTGASWSSVQQSADSEVLNIWMDTPKPPALSVQDTDGNTITERQDAQISDTESLHKATPARTASDRTYKELNPVPVIKPFLEWFVLDDFENRDESAPEVRVDRFLSAIYYSLSASCASPNTVGAQAAQTPQSGQDPAQQHAAQTEHMTVASQNPQVGHALQGAFTGQSGQFASLGLTSLQGQTPPTGQTSQASQTALSAQMLPTQANAIGRPNISVIGKTAREVDNLRYELRNQSGGGDTDIKQQLRKETVKLFGSYVPKMHSETLAPVRLFWGLLYELIVSTFLLRLLTCGAETECRRIVTICSLFTTRFGISTNGPRDCTLESITNIRLTTTPEK